MSSVFPAVSSRFQIVRRLGAGGMGVVYEALDTARNSRVALKTLRDLEASALLRFKTEFRSLQDLAHPNLITLDELIEENGRWFFTMELVLGVDFLSFVRSRWGEGPAARPDDETMVDFTRPSVTDTVPPPPEDDLGFDETRLRAALAQLVTGLLHLHGAHKVHRDIKPSNILVTRDGRVVVLDFGLVTDQRGSESTDANIVGTAAYMAPEQAASKPLGPEADWYAVGVMLYEALTGKLPFDGSAIQVLMQKQVREPEPPSALAANVPADLDQLVVDLLRFDPSKRPTGAELARRLGLKDVARGASLAPASLTAGVPFVGRGKELSTLDEAWGAVRTGTPVSVYVYGESGVGKSSLITRFLDRLGEPETKPLVVLRGRCYERESVPYKALDGVVDALSRWLMRQKTRDVEPLLPARAALLAQAFPVLRRVEAFANAPRVSFDALDPQEQRSRLFGALRELLFALAARARVVVVIDDLQWADSDSMALLREVMRPPAAPPLLLLFTLRAAPEGGTPTSQLNVGTSVLPGEVVFLPLSRLSSAEALDLAQKLIARVGPEIGGTTLTAEALARESQGHPFFIEELARHAALVGPSSSRAVSRLEDALYARVELLPPGARALLTILVVADQPIGREELERAAGVEEGALDVERNVSALRAGRFARPVSLGGRKALEPFHDKVRAAVLAHLGDDEKRATHRRLAVALETSVHPDTEALAEHWRGAGEPEKAAGYAMRAAEEAMEAFAFDRAARLYRLVLVLRTPPEEEARVVRRKLGDALANAGRGAEAAEMYLEAALGAGTGEMLELRRRAATQLLLSGHVEEGLSTFKNVLAELGLRYPDSEGSAVRSRILRRVWLRFRGFEFRPKDESAVADSERVRIDVCWSVGLGLGTVDPARGADFQTQGLLRALSAGDSYRIARAMALEAAYVAAAGVNHEASAFALLDRAGELAKKSGSAHALAVISLARAFAFYLWGRFADIAAHAERAENLFRERCVGAQTELDVAVLLSLRSRFFLGDLTGLRARMPAHLREAQERGNLYALYGLRTGHLVGAWLAQDDAEGAAAEIDDATRSWVEGTAFDLRSMQGWLGRSSIALYKNEPGPLYEQGLAMGKQLARSALRHVQLERVDYLWTMGRLAVATCPRGEATPRAKEVLSLAHKLAKEGSTFTEPAAALIEAGAAARRGDAKTAARRAHEAADLFDKLGMKALAAVSLRAAGIAEGDAAGATRAVDAEQALRALGVLKPALFARTYAPGFDP